MYRLGETASFDEDEFELAKWFGDAAALALDNAQVRARLEHQAQTDSLTDLYNHRVFHERLRAELMRASRARDSVALLMFDIDEFKRVNDICSSRGRRPDPRRAGRAHELARPRERRRLPHRRRGVRRDHAVRATRATRSASRDG